MAILERFGDIIKANINAVIDKMEDPSKMIDQYLRDMMEDFAEVKQATAGVMAEETRAKRQLDDNQAEVAKYTEYAKKALQAGNEADARTFVAKKQELENVGAALMTTYATAHENAVKIRQMHDKLASDIETLKTRREMINAKVAVAKTQQTLNDAAASINTAQGAMSAFSRMEDKASKMLDEATAMAELNAQPADEAKALEEKYASKGGPSVDDELDALKKELGI
ncbi:MAG TPA: PspA/IM30 family protein [Candidatus Acidoferrum sp.]|nr:PspA/IM30 family protein [Candidatus Acidoferrum sp.]